MFEAQDEANSEYDFSKSISEKVCESDNQHRINVSVSLIRLVTSVCHHNTDVNHGTLRRHT